MLKQEREALEMELRNLKIAQDSGDTPHIQEGQQAHDMDEPLSEEAARKRLERICKKNTQGHLGLYWHTLQLKPVACLSAAIHQKKCVVRYVTSILFDWIMCFKTILQGTYMSPAA